MQAMPPPTPPPTLSAGWRFFRGDGDDALAAHRRAGAALLRAGGHRSVPESGEWFAGTWLDQDPVEEEEMFVVPVVVPVVRYVLLLHELVEGVVADCDCHQAD